MCFHSSVYLAFSSHGIDFVRHTNSLCLCIWQEVIHILVLLLVLMVFYAWFGVVMFVDTDEGDNLFPSLVEGLWTLYICLTTANYPDVMMPGYNENRWVAVYFVSFMIITFFFFMNVILAAVVNEYDTNVRERRDRNTDFALNSLRKAYQLLTQEEAEQRTEEKVSLTDSSCSSRSRREHIDKKTVMDMFEILNTDFPEFRCKCSVHGRPFCTSFEF